MAAGIGLLKYQSTMLQTVFNLFVQSFKKQKVNLYNHPLKGNINNILPHQKVVFAYHEWLSVDQQYSNLIAPHLFPLWSYPTLFKLGEKLHLPLHKVLNQGCKMTINDDIPLNSPLNSHIEIFNMKEFDSKFRINQRVTTSTKYHPQALIAEIYAVILKTPHEKLSTTNSKTNKKYKVDDLLLINEISVDKKDAQSYAFISGDINPIHLSKKIAKLMGLKGSIMHGFGLFAMVFEELQKANYSIKEIDIRFLSPVYLNSKLKIYIKYIKEDSYQVKVFSSDCSQVHLTGTFKIKRAS